ncbi:hypothetical protein LS70_001135 [Helicobacter sp. MIT 11-5569]|uniref:hypothetical protein n=1 Tax=Helicobacter sp. MIT 11-5569 TaxID=1548151 RepID=UPI00068C9D31|nr:hypothetical protein [Helicobacter sp. MIT 11-5569]TLD85183.1 hypothetical protein LS70_001135 [Helicobacter sp. MIT 11-5569]
MNNDTNSKPYSTRYKELERTTGEINGMPYTILKLEYKNLDYLIENDLLCNGETGRFLSGFIGLTSKQIAPFEADEFGLVCPVYFDKKRTDLFGDKENITKIINFDLNHCWGTPIQLDMDFCLEKITELVQCIKKHNREENLTNTPPQIDYKSLLEADKGFRTEESLKSLAKDIAKEYNISLERAEKEIEKVLDNLMDSKEQRQKIINSKVESKEVKQTIQQSPKTPQKEIPKQLSKTTTTKQEKEQYRGR